ncbi:MAG: hypothetical protein ACNI3C_12775 [Candidatus Marinarcus sp.]|uniref:hypothetical protein n=1 Tax=Candidatus Marinarcus sp. TaxID=3100987 RepID=UPI003AFFBAAB
MSDIKEKLKTVVQETMIPEVEEYLEDLFKLLEENKSTPDDMDAIKEMESFLVELENILLVIQEDKMSDKEYQEVYDKIMDLIHESEEEEEEEA